MSLLFLRFSRYRDIAAEVAGRLFDGRGADALAPWTEEVLVPSRGLAQAIARELLTRVPNGIASLQIRTLETLARQLLNDAGEFPRVAGEGERRLAMRTAIRTIEHPMMETRGIASMLERSYRDVRDSGLTLADFRERVARARGLRNTERTRTILRAWTEYEKLIASLGAIDPSELFTRAAKHAGRARVQLVAGFYDATGVQAHLLEALRDAGRLAAMWIPIGSGDAYRFAQPFVKRFSTSSSSGSSEFLGSSGLLLRGAPRSSEEPEELLQVAPPPKLHVKKPQVELVEFDTRENEIRGTCAEIARLLAGGVDPASIGIVARSLDPYDARLFARFAAEHGFTTTFAEETPMLAQRVGRGLATLLRLRDRGFPRGDVMELVRDGFRPTTRLDVDKVDFETRKARIAGGTAEELRKIRKRNVIVDDYIALVEELQSLTERLANPLRGGDWATLLRELVTRFRVESEIDVAAVESVEAVASLFAKAQKWPTRFDVATIVDALEQHAVPSGARATVPAVWLGDVMKFRGRSFDHLFAVRMQDDLFPQRRVEDALLPDSDRRALKLREIGNGREEEQLLFQLVNDGAARLRFSFATTDGFGKVLRKSRMLAQLSAQTKLSAETKLSAVSSQLSGESGQNAAGDIGHLRAESCELRANRELKAASSRQLQLLIHAGKRGPFDGYLGSETPRPRIQQSLQAVTPTQLEDFGECPQKFLLKHVLGVVDIDDPQRELQINHRDKGTIDHRILERFYRHVGDVSAAAADLPRLAPETSEKLQSIVDEEFDRLEADAPPYNRTLRAIERRTTKRILNDFVANDLGDLVDGGLEPKHFEYRFGSKYRERADHPEPFLVEAHGVTIRIDGSIDRIDAGDGRYRIVDYKSGKALRHANLADKIDRGVRLQLALYAMAVAAFFELDEDSVTGTIKPLVIGDAKPAKFEFKLAEKKQELLATLDTFVGAITGGAFPAFPNERDDEFNSCKYCPVSHSCRTKHDPDERYAVAQSKDPKTLLRETLA